MSDLREQVARAIYQPDTGHEGDWNGESVGKKFHYRQIAAAAIAVVIEELANRADAAIMAGVFGRMPLADWLRAQDEGENTR